MKSRLVALIVSTLALSSAASYTQAEPGDLPHGIKRLPKVIPTADELANPELYHPAYDTEYALPPASGLPAPPPAEVVRPGEFEPMDYALITILDYGPEFFPMWRDMMDAFSDVTFTYIIIENSTVQGTVETMLGSAGVPADTYTYLDYPVDSIWARDYGPELVREEDGTRHIVDFAYYPGGRPLDDAIPGLVSADTWINADGSPMGIHANDLEVNGGNIMTDGAGTCFFSDIIYGYEKPSSWSNDDVDQAVRDYLGCEQIITLKPICQDGTGHIDLYAKMMGRHSILLGEYPSDTHFTGSNPSNMDYGYCDDFAYPNDYQDQEDNLATIEATANVDGEPWVVTRMPMLEPYWDPSWGGFWVYRSYMNSLVINGVIAMPSYYDLHGDETNDYLLNKEAEAIAAYEAAAPNGVVVWPIDSDAIIPSAGAIHCITHEIPAEDDYEYTEPGDTDTDADAGADAGGTTGSADGGCGCSAAGAEAGGSILSLLSSYL